MLIEPLSALRQQIKTDKRKNEQAVFWIEPLYIENNTYIRVRKIDGNQRKEKEGGGLRTEDYLSNDLLYVLGMVLSGLFIAYLSLPCLNKARISSNVLFLVSGTCLYVKIQKMARNALNGRNV